IPPSLIDLLRVDGIGPKRAWQLYDTLGITNLDELAQAAQAGKLRELPKMGAKSEAKILQGIAELEKHGDERRPLGEAWPLAQEILAVLIQIPGVRQTAVAGSARRMRETVHDIDLLIAAEDAAPVMDAFVSLPQVESVSGRGPTKSSVTLVNGLQVDLRVLPADRWGTLLLYFTGSKDHNVRLRELALKQGLRLNEYGFTSADGRPEILCATEEKAYQTLGLPYILPTLREDRGEIEAALSGTLPDVIRSEQIISDLHMHTTWSDGKLSVLEMARAAKARGCQYIAITDHSASLGIAHGLSVERLRQQAAEIRQANEALGPDFRILRGTEMEIKADGTLDYPDEVLAELDFVIAALHVSLKQPREQATQRILNAIHNPHVDMIAHPSGRLIGERPPADLDMEAILQAAAETGTIMEVNANPHRLDLKDIYVRRAMALGVKIAINTDAHNAEQFNLLHFGVGTAQRGWATAVNVINTWPLEQLLAWLREKS
ncbi:MAG TPA: DNA polymerase/3'-5' exonuclease PolX, partial [Anaerolineae bacterium]|nr:DNA polymerase/3'-5' exonuclease PolX [Anaerolineae bacterium]